MGRYLELTKPRITVFILMSTAIGFLAGAHGALHWTVWTLLHTLVGTALMASGTAALNQWYEREADGKMNRTKARPIPSGRITAPRAFWFGMLLSLAGFLELWRGANLLTGLLGGFHDGELSARLHAAEAALAAFDHRGRDSRRHAAPDRICSRRRHAHR